MGSTAFFFHRIYHIILADYDLHFTHVHCIAERSAEHVRYCNYSNRCLNNGHISRKIHCVNTIVCLTSNQKVVTMVMM